MAHGHALNTRVGGALVALALAAGAHAQVSTPDPINKYVWGENIGWGNALDPADGVLEVVGSGNEIPGWLFGSIWQENVGWIRLSSRAAPALLLGPHPNTSGSDWGVNINATPSNGRLSGYAWGENIGWINFDLSPSTGLPATVYNCGAIQGFAWSENAGWIDFGTLGFRPACPADYNCSVSPAVTVQDIFDFLAHWFAGIPKADFNRSGTITVQDIFDFLTAWFIGC